MSALHNPSQERFCQIVHRRTLEGEKRSVARTAAYRDAIYEGGDATDEQLAPNARRYSNQSHIKARIAQIAEYEAKLAGMDRVWLLVRVKGMIEDDGKDRVPAARLLNDMQGWGAPSKHEHSGPDGAPIQHEDVSHQALADAILAYQERNRPQPQE